MQSYEEAEVASPPWPDQVLVEARSANPAFDAYFDAVVSDLEPLIRWFKDGCDFDATRLELLQHFPDGPVQGVKEDIVEDVLRLMSTFEATTLSGAFKLQLEIVNHDMCCLFHQDYYRQRLICTLKGPGTEWLDHDNVNRAALGKGDNDAIVKDMAKVHRANTHDVLLLKGAKYGGGATSVIHRSPPIAHQKGLRVLLKLDE